MKKVLIIGPLPPPIGGMETVMEQMKNLNFDEYKLIFFNVSKNSIIKSNIIFKTLNFMYRCVKLMCILFIENPEIVHIHTSSYKSYQQNAVYLKICLAFHKKTLLHMHGGAFEEFYNNTKNANKASITRTLRSANGLIVLTEGWKNFYSKIHANKNISVVPNTIDLNIIQKYYRYKKGSKTTRLLFIGRIEKEKGIYELLEVIRILRDMDIHLFVMGPFMNNERKIKNLCSDYGITHKITFLGSIQGNDRFKYFANSDIFVLPSYYEGLPLSVLEAMAFGMPIIATRVGSISEIIKRENGILIDPKNIKELENAILNIINSGKLGFHNKNNIKKIKRYYNIPVFQRKILEIYETIK